MILNDNYVFKWQQENGVHELLSFINLCALVSYYSQYFIKKTWFSESLDNLILKVLHRDLESVWNASRQSP